MVTHFAYWSVNDVRQHGPTGVALSQINPKIENDSSLIAHYFLSTLDSDNDSGHGLVRVYNQFGNLSNGPAGDPDGDGFYQQPGKCTWTGVKYQRFSSGRRNFVPDFRRCALLSPSQ